MDSSAPLHADLKIFLIKDRTKSMIKHPLLFELDYDPSLNSKLNQKYLLKKKMAEDAYHCRRWSTYIFMYEPSFLLIPFMKVMKEMKDEEYWFYLGDIWRNADTIYNHLDNWKTYLASKKPQKHLFMMEREREKLASLEDKLILYRACLKGVNENGLSYTLDREVAECFLQELRSTSYMMVKKKTVPIITKIEIPKSRVFAYISSNGEDEIIIHPHAKFTNLVDAS